MSKVDLEQRLARMRAEMKSRGMSQFNQAGEPWTYSLPQAAAVLGLALPRVRRLVRAGLLRAVLLDELVVSVSALRAFQRSRGLSTR